MSATTLSEAIDAASICSLLFLASLCLTSYYAGHYFLARNTPAKTRFLYIWHVYDALIHVLFEGSFLYYSFFSSAATGRVGHSSGVLWGDLSREYGAKHSTSVIGNLWIEYGKADARWANADVGIVTLELVISLLGGPLAAWISELIRRGDGRAWYWMLVLAVAEIYGGWMTFVPEWLSGSQNLDTSNVMYKWLYLFSLNIVWIIIPVWVCREAYNALLPALAYEAVVARASRAATSIAGINFDHDSSDIVDSETDTGVRGKKSQ